MADADATTRVAAQKGLFPREPKHRIGALVIEELSAKALETVVVGITKILLKEHIESPLQEDVKVEVTKERIDDHLRWIEGWCSTFNFRDLPGPRRLTDTYVDLDLDLGRLASRDAERSARRMAVSDLLTAGGNFAILGDAGAGKTTSLKRLARGVLLRAARSPGSATPIVIRIRELDTNTDIIQAILSRIGVSVSVEAVSPLSEIATFRMKTARHYLGALKAVLFIDGLDEISVDERERIVASIDELLLHKPTFRTILTSRVADFRYRFHHTTVLSLEPLSRSQRKQFAAKWLGPVPAEEFLRQVGNHPYAGAEVTPLTFAHLCAIYERSGNVPERPGDIYRKIVRLLVSEWDEQRLVHRKPLYPGFDAFRKESFLQSLAYGLAAKWHRTRFAEKEVEAVFREIQDRFGLRGAEFRTAVREVEAHTGLLIQVSVEPTYYEFVHKSIQEYLVAEYIRSLPALPSVATLYPDEMALVVALSPSSSEYFIELARALRRLSAKKLREFVGPFARRLLIEKPDFDPTQELGWAVSGLYSSLLSSGASPVSLRYGFSPDELGELLQSEKVKEAVRLALSNSLVRKDRGNAFRIVPLRDIRDETEVLFLDTSFLTLVDWDPHK